MRRIVLIGATGEFGGRLARSLVRLADPGNFELLVTSRRQDKAEALAASLRARSSGTRITPFAFTRGHDDAEFFDRTRPWLVIDASGPFQGADYKTAHAALASGAHWIDLADAEDYILGFRPALDTVARAKGVAAFAGASSTPALSFAAVQRLTGGWQRVDTIDIAIYPAGASEVGEAVIAAVLSYAGRPIAYLDKGARAETLGWARPQRVDVPGLGSRFRAPVATADWAILKDSFAVTGRVAFFAGLEARVEQFGLAALAAVVARGWLKDAVPLAPLLLKARALTRLAASDKGGMTVDVSGLDGNGRPTTASWWLTAEKGDGPNVPALAALALCRKLLKEALIPGARHAAGAVISRRNRSGNAAFRPLAAHALCAADRAENTAFAAARPGRAHLCAAMRPVSCC